jgi:hypothetical protein
MSVTDLPEVGKTFGSVSVVWFALVGWKLLHAIRAFRSHEESPSSRGSLNGSGLQVATLSVRDARPA